MEVEGEEVPAERDGGAVIGDADDETREDEEEARRGLPDTFSAVEHSRVEEEFEEEEEGVEGPLKKRGAVIRSMDEQRMGSDGWESRVKTGQRTPAKGLGAGAKQGIFEISSLQMHSSGVLSAHRRSSVELSSLQMPSDVLPRGRLHPSPAGGTKSSNQQTARYQP